MYTELSKNVQCTRNYKITMYIVQSKMNWKIPWFTKRRLSASQNQILIAICSVTQADISFSPPFSNPISPPESWICFVSLKASGATIWYLVRGWAWEPSFAWGYTSLFKGVTGNVWWLSWVCSIVINLFRIH